MTANFKEYLGTIEVKIDGIIYEIGLREEAPRALRGIWTCTVCDVSEVTGQLKEVTGQAIDLARSELMTHHDKVHFGK